MCGRYGLVSTDKLAERFDAEKFKSELDKRYNIAPCQNLPVVTRHSPNQIEIMRWGLIPFWAKDEKIGYRMINARAETVAEKNSFKKSLQSMRCLVPADFFYEWQVTKEGKQPMLIRLKSQEIFAFAGLYSTWKNPEGEEIKTYTIITTEPNKIITPIHNRMPVILTRDEEDEWLNPDMVEPEHILKYLDPYPSDEMEAYPISKSVNSPSVDNSSIIKNLEI